MKQLIDGAWVWSVWKQGAFEGVAFNGYYLELGDERVVVDPPPLNDWDVEHLSALGAPTQVVVTNTHHLRAATAVCERFGAKLHVPAADAESIAELNDLDRNLERTIAGRAQIFVPKVGGDPPGNGAAPPAALAKPTVVAGGGGKGSTAKAGAGCGVDGRPCLHWPVAGKLSSGFGERDGKPHDGIDIAASRGTAIGAAAAGRVIYSGDEIKGYGNLVIVSHEGGLVTVYAHCDRNLVTEGDAVEVGHKLAEVGQTGTATAPHLHFEVRVDERPLDPLLYLQEEGKE